MLLILSTRGGRASRVSENKCLLYPRRTHITAKKEGEAGGEGGRKRWVKSDWSGWKHKRPGVVAPRALFSPQTFNKAVDEAFDRLTGETFVSRSKRRSIDQ